MGKNPLVIANPMFIHASFHPFPNLYIRCMLCFQCSEFQKSLCLLWGFNFFSCTVCFFLRSVLIFTWFPIWTLVKQWLIFFVLFLCLVIAFSVYCCIFWNLVLQCLTDCFPSILICLVYQWLHSGQNYIYIWIYVNHSFSLKIKHSKVQCFDSYYYYKYHKKLFKKWIKYLVSAG